MKYFKLTTRLEHSDINEQAKGEKEYWENTMNISEINGCQQRRLVEMFLPLVEKNGDLLINLAKRAL